MRTLLLIFFFFKGGVHLYAADSSIVEEPIILQSATGAVSGTITLPANTNKKVAIAIIIAGLGPADRDGNSAGFNNNSLKMLAHGLAVNQIASLRYDKRGIAASSSAASGESQLNFDMHVTDVLNWIDLLQKDSRFSGIFIIGHSEGSLIGMLAAPFLGNGFISIAGASVPGDKFIREQMAAQEFTSSKEAERILDALAAGNRVAEISPSLQTFFRPSLQPYLINWFRYDPCEHIARIDKPVLVIAGDQDLRVPLHHAKKLASCKTNSKLVKIANMNHVLKITGPGVKENVATFNDSTKPVSPALIKEIVAFIKRNK